MTVTGRVLLVDDAEPHRYIVGSWLRRAGYEVVEAATGAEALACLGPDFDVAVLDVNLPDMSGTEVCAVIKAGEETSSLPVVHVSVTAIDIKSRVAGLDGGADAYLVEPLDPQEFLAIVRAMARARASRRQADRFSARLRRQAVVTVPMNEADTLSRFLEAAAVAAADVFGAPALAAVTVENGRVARTLCARPGETLISELGKPLSEARVTRRAVSELAAAPQEWQSLLRQGGIADRRWCIATMNGRGGVSGCLAVALADGAESLGESDSFLLRQMAEAMRVALENLHAYTEEQHIALTLQHTLLPDRLPVVPGFTFEARYVASSERASVGGDFYDVFELPSGRIVALIGDVQGHSLRAATVMAELRFAIRAYLLEMHDPATALRLLNELAIRNYPDDTATVVLAVFDASSGQVEVVNAGHLPPLLVTDREAEYAEGGGLLIGMPGPAPAPVWLELPEQACLVLVTDGLIERRGESLDEGLEKMRDAVSTAGALDPGAIADLLLERFAAPVAEDDVAILVVGRDQH